MSAQQNEQPVAAGAERAPWWAAVVICAAAVAAYHNSFHGPFVFDDASSITTNPTIQRLWPLTQPLSPPTTNVTAQGRPILNLSLAINYAIGGTAVEGYHVINLVIHALAGLTLFGIVRRTLLLPMMAAALSAVAGGNRSARPSAVGPASRFALAVAVLWTVHPLQTESVTYVIQRAESLMGLFYLLTLYCFLRGVEPRPAAAATGAGWLALSLFACALGMATKEVMATAPLMVALFDRTLVAGSWREVWRRRGRFFAALAGTWLLLGWLVLQTGGNRGGSVGFGVGVAWWDYWLTQLPAIVHYLRLVFWPHPLVFEYGSFWVASPLDVVGEALVVFALLGATIVGLGRRSAWGFLGAWFFGVLAPTCLAPGTTQMIVEHRMYLSLAAVIVAMVAAVNAVVRQRRLASVVLGGCALVATGLTVRRNEDYRSEVALWQHTIALRPANPLAHFMLAGAWERAGEPARAGASYAEALRLQPDFSVGHEHFGQWLLKQGRRAEAIGQFEAALRLQPAFADAHANLGNALLAEGRGAEAVAHLAAAVELTPESAEMRYNFGNALAGVGRMDEAAVQYDSALKLKPGVAEVHFNLANALGVLGRGPAAIAQYESALAQRPDFPAAHYNLGNVLAQAGRAADAVPHYRAAIALRPGYADAHNNLGAALLELGRRDEAIACFEQALRLDPSFSDTRATLARLRATGSPPIR